MVSQERKRRAGEVLMAVSFLAVVAPFFVFRVPRPILALIGFVGFMIGSELYLRNRKHWNDV